MGNTNERSPDSPKRGLDWRYPGSAIALVAVVVGVVVVHSLLYPRINRGPAEFLPATTRVAVVADLSPGSASVGRMREVWPAADIAHLTERATDLSQELTDWTGLKLDLSKDAALWFGGELAAAAVGEAGQPLGPRSLVLITRVTSLRRARVSLDRAVAPMARDLHWQKSVLKRDYGPITVWGAAPGKEEVAYATVDGCLLLSPGSAAIDECVLAARGLKPRLGASQAFQKSTQGLAGESLLWCYLDLASVSRGTRYLLPAITRGWSGVLREHLRSGLGIERVPEPAGAGSALAFGVIPEAGGIRLRGTYWRASASSTAPASAHLERLATLLPRECVAYALVHEPAGGWLPLLGLSQPAGRVFPRLPADSSGRRGERAKPSLLAGPQIPWLALAVMPRDLLVALIGPPRGEGPAVVLAAPSKQIVGPFRAFASSLIPGSVSAEIGDITVFASRQQALRACEAAAKDGARRLSPPRGVGCSFELWAEPSVLSRELAHFSEVQLRGSETAGGGEGELSLKAEPRHLLGD
jgi:hypothetical protein